MVEFKKIVGNEFSRLLAPAQLAELPITVEISAEAGERAALAARFELLDLARLTARLAVEAAAKPGVIVVKGHITAAATQACVVTLEPVEVRLSEAFETAFAVQGRDDALARAAADPDEEPPEPLDAEGLDLGELVAQQFAVALDPYPRAAGATVAAEWAAPPDQEPGKQSPFAVLRGLPEKT